MRFYKIFSALVFVTLFISSAISAGTSKDKIYVPRDAIELSDEGMCLIIGDDELIPIHALYSDENGLYVCDVQFIAKYGYCRRCQDVHKGGECPPDRSK